MSNALEHRPKARAERQGGRLLVEHLRRWRRGSGAAPAVHVHMRDPLPSAHGTALLKLLGQPLQDLARDREAPIFPLSEQDTVIISENIKPADVLAATTLGEPDPLLPLETAQPLIRWYDLNDADERLSLLALARAFAEGAEPNKAAPAETLRRPLDTKALSDINKRLKSTPIVELARKQAVLLATAERFQPMFHEVYVSIGELQRRLAPRIDLFSRPALFRYLTEILDAHVLKALNEGAIGGAEPMSLNLNVRSICSAEFQAVLASRDRTQLFVVEVPISDLLANPGGFQRASAIVRNGKAQLAVDGLTPLMLAFLDLSTLTADFFKVAWDAAALAIQSSPRRDALAERINSLGPDRVIFTRLESLDGLKAALALGVKRLQGHLIDRLAAAQGARSCDDR
jgi:EAL domain-containing protein (putative c-di-GMP-specific phosphodiesterase class I)